MTVYNIRTTDIKEKSPRFTNNKIKEMEINKIFIYCKLIGKFQLNFA